MNPHFHTSDCPDDCVGQEERLQWTHYPNVPAWRLERVWVAHQNVDGNRETSEFRVPVIVEFTRGQ